MRYLPVIEVVEIASINARLARKLVKQVQRQRAHDARVKAERQHEAFDAATHTLQGKA